MVNKRRKIDSGNAFSALQNLSRSGDSPSVSAPSSPARTPGPKARPEQEQRAAAPRSITKHASFKLSKDNIRRRSDGITELRLSAGDRFVVLGSFKLKVTQGLVTIAGATLYPSDDAVQVHAPSCHALPVIRMKDSSVIQLHECPNGSELRQLGRLSSLFKGIWNERSGDEVPGNRAASFKVITSSEDVTEKCIIQELASPPEWNKALSDLEDKPDCNKEKVRPNFTTGPERAYVTLVCGPKSAGKSTFSRLLTNRLVTKLPPNPEPRGVMVLDLDPGQPEYSVPGTISLVHVLQPNLGPSFTNVNAERICQRIVRSHAVAAPTPASNIDLYRKAFTDLFSTYQEAYNRLPLIVNTPGWILGTGLDMLQAMIVLLKPDSVVYMSRNGPQETLDGIEEAVESAAADAATLGAKGWKPDTLSLPSQTTEHTARTGAQLRAMSTMSYFHSEYPQMGDPKWGVVPLSSLRPWRLAFAEPNRGILGIMAYEQQPQPDLLAEAINGMVLAVVEVQDPKAYGQSQNYTLSNTPEGIPYLENTDGSTLDPQYSHTVGIVLVRGIEKGFLQVVTPVSTDVIGKARQLKRDLVLVHGNFDTPDWAYKEHLHYRSEADEEEGDSDATETAAQSSGQSTASSARGSNIHGGVLTGDAAAIPWIDVLGGGERRPPGSKAWKVRRDLGRNRGGQ